MKHWTKILAALAVLAFASKGWAGSDAYSIGHSNNGTISVEMSLYNSIYISGAVTIYQNGEMVAVADTDGVTSLATGVTYTGSDGWYTFYGAPAGDYTATFSVSGSSAGYYSYSYSWNSIHWAGDYGDSADAVFYVD